MVQTEPEVKTTDLARRGKIVNDFCITFSTVNGSGSITANVTLLRAFFQMGIPVSGKNIFPSNIQGMPTWYTIRLNKDGFLGRLEKDDIVVAMNSSTFTTELEYIVPGGVLLYDDDIRQPINREDIVVYPMPVKKLVKEADVPVNLKGYAANVVYVGVLAHLLGIPLEVLRDVLNVHFKGKAKAIDPNMRVITLAYEWAKVNVIKQDPYYIEPMQGTEGYLLSDGNTAAALGSIYGGVQFVGWYPITPATGLPEALSEYMPVLRRDPSTGKNTYTIIQAEDELAAIGMAVGAGWAGLRAMTATSGPGLSLMSEYMGMAYFTEVPVVVWDVQRVGPSTGLPTRTSQGDVTFVYFMSHGDTQYIILFPCSVTECFEFGWKAFDLAEHFQTPVIVMSDQDLGMNHWMTKKFTYPDRPMDRGKILWEKDLEELLVRSNGKWGRYLDVDGDGIPYRTVMGNRHPRSAYFTRGTGHDEYAMYNEHPENWESNLDRVRHKLAGARQFVPKPVIQSMQGAQVGIIAYGSSDMPVREAMVKLAKSGIMTDYLRIRAVPFTPEISEFIKNHDRVYVVEANADGQMCQLLTMEYPELAVKLVKTAHTDGVPLAARWIKDTILAKEESSHV